MGVALPTAFARPTHRDRDPRGRIAALDLARALALACMVLFHLVRDLEVFGALPAGTTLAGGWALFARAIAGAFLLLSGISFVLCHGRGLRWRVWLRHLATVAAAAVMVSAVTYVAFPERWVHFGILHAIAFCSLLAPLALRLPTAGLAAAACGVAVLHAVAGRAVFDAATLAWTGLGRIVPPSLDFIPVVPWAAAFLAGMALARSAGVARLEGWRTERGVPVATTASRHSLAIYLLHQPVLLALIWLASGSSDEGQRAGHVAVGTQSSKFKALSPYNV